ncbi:winged helix-turn-helix domain-containing protein [Pseudobacillus badius]|uniref:winged helix-turn-helix domain-containing protein n=1 Tax=Bacillus badius TaxID=1455 RepID=UPI003D341B8D
MIGLLLKNSNVAFSRTHLMEVVWGNNTFTEDRTVDSHIRNIRDKLRKEGFPVDVH